MGEIINAYVLVVKHQGKSPLKRPGCKCEDNIKVVLKEI